jgi:hypothetical protein
MEKEKFPPTFEKICIQAISVVKKYITKEPETIIGIEEKEGLWKVMVEALERKAVPDTQDLLGRYEISFNKNGELIGWKQKMVRKRADKMVQVEESETETSP